MQVVSDSASAAGVASVPTPITQADADFFVYESLVTSFLFASAVGISDGNQGQRFDSKAMRKVGIDEDIVVTVENGNATDGANIAFVGRMLVKLL